MIERLRKLEQSGLTPLPPPPVPAPVQRPEFGPDLPSKPGTPLPPPVTGPQTLGTPPGRPPVPASSSPAVSAAQAIVSITLNDLPTTVKPAAGAPVPLKDMPKGAHARGDYLPTGSFTRAVLLGGLD